MYWLVETHKEKKPSRFWNMFLWLFNKVFFPYTMIRTFLSSYKQRNLHQKLQGKIVLITGASSGLGESLAHEFYEAGCRLILASRGKTQLTRVSQDLMRLHVTGTTYPPVVMELDLANLSSIPEFSKQALSVYGKIDIVINNGGISYRGEAKDTSIDVDIKVMCVNYFGQIALTKAILPSFIQKKSGHIVCISSVQGKIAIPQRSCYAASKHALQAFMDSLRAELVNTNVKVTVISPGYIQTNLSVNAVTASGAKYDVMDPSTANGMSPEEVSKRIIKCVTDENKELIISSFSPRLVVLIRTLLPSLYFYIMGKRAQRLSNKDKDC